MELTPADIDILDKFHRNELSEEELSNLQVRMKDSEFSEAAKAYLETIAVIQTAGRNELKSMFSSIQSDVEKNDGLEKYEPSAKSKGSGGSGFMAVIVVIVGIAAYLFFSGKLRTKDLQKVFPDNNGIDTVYHYQVKRDTVIVNKTDSIRRKTIRRVKTDTVYIRKNVTVSDTSVIFMEDNSKSK